MEIVGADGKRSATDYDTLAFKLEVRCEKNNHTEKDDGHPNMAYQHANGNLRAFSPLITLQYIVGISNGFPRGIRSYGSNILLSSLCRMIFSLQNFDRVR